MINYSPNKKAILKSEYMNNFASSKCILTISVGQPNHEDDKFFSTILAVNKQFKSCLVMVCDSLQRHTMKISAPQNITDLHHISNSLGNEWITRNSPAINELIIPYQICRWDHWITHQNFEQKNALIKALYSSDPLFKESVDDTALEFSTRKMSTALVDIDTAFNLSKEYLLEECAVMLLQAEEGYQFEIYPSKRNNAMDYVYQQVISYTNKNLMRAVSIKFKNLNSINIQEIELELA